MAISLASLSAPAAKPAIITIIGEGGVGKTSLAALFPSPVIIPVEDGLASLVGSDIQAFPLVQNSQEVFDAITVLATEDHSFKTLIIDSISQLNTILEKEVVESDPKAISINTALGGFGAGQGAVSERHRQLRTWCDHLLRGKNMNIVFIAHADVETLELPDVDSYMRYTLRLNKKSAAHYSDNVDMVAYVKLKTFTRGKEDETKKAIGDGSRIITCYPVPSHISKNRYKITEDLPYAEGENPFAEIIPSLKGA